MEKTENRFNIRAFGIAREIFGGKEIVLECPATSVGELKRELRAHYPALNGLKSFFIAVNHEYAEDHQLVQFSDEIAIIPPVSGG